MVAMAFLLEVASVAIYFRRAIVDLEENFLRKAVRERS